MNKDWESKRSPADTSPGLPECEPLAPGQAKPSSNWDIEDLRREIRDLLSFGPDLEILGFQAPEIDVILDQGD